jgi:hypothetical protein
MEVVISNAKEGLPARVYLLFLGLSTVPDYFGNYSLVDCTLEIGRRTLIESGIGVGVSVWI